MVVTLLKTIVILKRSLFYMETDKRTSFMDGKFMTFITASLKGISQVILIENAITGLLILIAITIESYYLGIIALLFAILDLS